MAELSADPITREEARLLPGLTGDRVALRPLGPEHAEEMYEAQDESRKEIGRWLSWCHPDYSHEDARTFAESRVQAWSEGSEYAFAILAIEENLRLVGVCGLNEVHPLHRFANLGYWIRSSATHQG